MRKHLITIFTVLSASMIYAQEGRVGINTSAPNATLDVTASATDLTRTDGFIAPRLTGDELKAKDGLYMTPQTGAIVYATAPANPTTAKTINVTEAGYYYFDGTVWIKFPQKYVEPWNVAGTNNPATSNSQNIYQNGRIGIKNNNAINYALHIVNDNIHPNDDDITIESYGNLSPQVRLVSPRGTLASPEVLQANDVIGALQFLGKTNNSQYSVLGTIRSFYRNDGGTNIGGELNFGTNGISRMVISPNGNVGINKPNPTAKLHVVKTSAELTPAIIEGCNVYSNNSDAVSAGLPVGALYRTATGQLMVRY